MSAPQPEALVRAAHARFAIAATIANDVAEAGDAANEGAVVGAASTIAAAFPDGRTIVELPGRPPLALAAAAVAPSPQSWVDSVFFALIARDDDSLEALRDPRHLRAIVARTNLGQGRFWRPYCRALASVVSDDPDDASDPLDELDDAPPPFEQHLAAAIPLLRALASANHDGWQVAVDEALAAHARYHHQQPERLLSLAVTGLAALAFDRDDVATEGVPRALVRHEQPRPAGRAVYEYATRYADRVDDPHDFLLLEGYLGDQESEIEGRADGSCLAHFELARPGLPHARIDFLLPLDGRSPRGDRLPALDLGERVMLAYYYGELPEQHAPHLAHAIELLDVVLRAIPEGSDALPEAALLTERGRAYHRQDPRRFHHDALRAHRQMLALRLSNKAAQPA